MLERLRANIQDISWQRKIIYLHALQALGPTWDEDAGRRELQKLGPITQDDDVETIQLYIDLLGDTLSFSEKIVLVDRVIRGSDKLSDVIHYKGLKAVLYFLIEDRTGAETELSEAINIGRSAQTDGRVNTYELYRLAHAIELMGVIRTDIAVMDEALLMYRELADAPEYTAKGRADIFRSIGDIYRYSAAWADASKAYARAIELDDPSICKILLADCQRNLGQITDAEATLEKVAQGDLEDSERTDYVFVLAGLAVEFGDRDRLERAKIALSAITLREPLFRGRRDEYLIAVHEALASGPTQKQKGRVRALLAGLTRSTSRYLVLRPTFMGMGVDVGKILEDLAREKNVKKP